MMACDVSPVAMFHLDSSQGVRGSIKHKILPQIFTDIYFSYDFLSQPTQGDFYNIEPTIISTTAFSKVYTEIYHRYPHLGFVDE